MRIQYRQIHNLLTPLVNKTWKFDSRNAWNRFSRTNRKNRRTQWVTAVLYWYQGHPECLLIWDKGSRTVLKKFALCYYSAFYNRIAKKILKHALFSNYRSGCALLGRVFVGGWHWSCDRGGSRESWSCRRGGGGDRDWKMALEISANGGLCWNDSF